MNYNQSFTVLFNENKHIIYPLVNKYIDDYYFREDIEQDIAIAAYKSFPGFKGKSKFSTWLYEIARNVIWTFLRTKNYAFVKYKLKTLRLDNALFEIVYEGPDMDEERYRKKIFDLGFSKLNSLEQRITNLYLENKSYAEMEEITGLNENLLRVKMSRIKEKIRKVKNQFMLMESPFLIR